MIKEDSVYLKHISESIKRIEEYTKGITKEEFVSKNIIQAAVIKEIEIIGEASRMLSNSFKEVNNEIPWKNIIGMRDKLIHGYFGVDLDSVWKTIKEDIPALRKNINKIKE